MVAQLSCFLHNARRDIYNRTELCHVVNYVRFSYYWNELKANYCWSDILRIEKFVFQA